MIVKHNLRLTEIVYKVHCVHDTCTKTHVCVDAIRAIVCLLQQRSGVANIRSCCFAEVSCVHIQLRVGWITDYVLVVEV